MINLQHSGFMDESLGFGSRVGQSDWLIEVPRLTAGSWLAALANMEIRDAEYHRLEKEYLEIIFYEMNHFPSVKRNFMAVEKECMEGVNSYQEVFYYIPEKKEGGASMHS